MAGPVVAGVAVLPAHLDAPWVGLVRDSKQMTPAQREYVLPFLQDAALALEVGASSPQEIDQLGIVGATRLAMKRALNSLALMPQFLLLDAFPLPGSRYHKRPSFTETPCASQSQPPPWSPRSPATGS